MTVLDQCRSVDSYSDYVVFVQEVLMSKNEIIRGIEDINFSLSTLEMLGYDKHPEVGPMIKETRSLGGMTGDCIVELKNRYEN